MSNVANGAEKLIKALKTSNKLFIRLQEVTQDNPELQSMLFNSISPNNVQRSIELIEELGARDLYKLINEIDKRLYESKDN